MEQRERALVIGGSMAGLFAARVLSDHFKEVIILERDYLPSEPEQRNGTPQARHLHQILGGGQAVMERLFPELKQDLRDVGAPKMEWGVDDIILLPTGRSQSMPTGVVTNTCSRITLEFLIRRRLLERGNIQILEGHRTTSLIANDDKTRILGVEVQLNRKRETQQFFGDLIVDASGRGSKTPTYFEQLGYEQPEQTYINAHIGYSTVWLKKPENYPEKFVMMTSLGYGDPHPAAGNRNGIITEIEGDRWVAIISSNNKDYPPTDFDGFLEFTKTLNQPDIYKALASAEPISPVYGSRSTYSLWRHYEKLGRRPENFIVTGDAACGFNPFYGQGMSVAALDAELLDRTLREWQSTDLTGFAAKFQTNLAEFLQWPWGMATASDKIQPTAEGDIVTPTRADRIADTYFDWVLMTTTEDIVIMTAFIKVMNMLAPPESLLKPNVLLRVLWHRMFSVKPPPTTAQKATPATAVGD